LFFCLILFINWDLLGFLLEILLLREGRLARLMAKPPLRRVLLLIDAGLVPPLLLEEVHVLWGLMEYHRRK
jgi:hypothetical protein